MSLYITNFTNITNRKSETIFSFKDGEYYLVKGNSLKPFNKILDIKDVIKLTETNNINGFEIDVSNITNIKDLLTYLSNILLDNDLNIGLLTKEINFINSNKQLLYEYGVTIAYKSEHNILPPRGRDISLPIIRKYKNSKKKILVKPTSPCLEESDSKNDHFKDEDYLSKKILNKPKTTIKLDESFHDKFMKLIIESGKDNVEIYKNSGVTRQVFSKIISNKDMIPTKLTLTSLCIGLELDIRTVKELMESAGYSLSKSLMFDSIVMKYIRLEIYDFDLINSELDEFGCQLLGWHPRDN